MESAVARRYAQALLAVGEQQGTLEALDGQAKVLAGLFADKQLRAFFLTPTIPAERKKMALERSLRGKVDPMLLNLSKLLVDKGRMGHLPDVMRAFDRLTDELSGVEEVTLISAVPLSDEQRKAIVEAVTRFAAYGELRVKTEVDPSVLGGVLIKLGSQVIDGTVAAKLADLHQHITAPAWQKA